MDQDQTVTTGRQIDAADVVYSDPQTKMVSEQERNELIKIQDAAMGVAKKHAVFFKRFPAVRGLMRDIVTETIKMMKREKISLEDVAFEVTVMSEHVAHIVMTQGYISEDSTEYNPPAKPLDYMEATLVAPYLAIISEFPKLTGIVQNCEGISSVLMKFWRFMYTAMETGEMSAKTKFAVCRVPMDNNDLVIGVNWSA